jgi:preprotein translocase subunit SecG
VESFQGVESMFGTKTNSFLARTTTILSILFFITCLSLAVLSVRQSRSLLKNVRPQTSTQKTNPLAEPEKGVTQEQVPQKEQAQEPLKK